MKYFAYKDENHNSEMVCVFDIARDLNNNPDKYRNRRYYSTENLAPMVARIGSKRIPHFAYISGYANDNESKGGESIEHAMVKQRIAIMGELVLKSRDKTGIIKFSDAKVEYPFNNREYIADIYVEITESTLSEFNSGDRLAIEVFCSHKVDYVKQAFFKANNILAIELKVWQKLKYDGDIELFKRQVEGWLRKPRLFTILSLPLQVKKRSLAATNRERNLKTQTRQQLKDKSVESLLDRIIKFFIR